VEGSLLLSLCTGVGDVSFPFPLKTTKRGAWNLAWSLCSLSVCVTHPVLGSNASSTAGSAYFSSAFARRLRRPMGDSPPRGKREEGWGKRLPVFRSDFTKMKCVRVVRVRRVHTQRVGADLTAPPPRYRGFTSHPSRVCVSGVHPTHSTSSLPRLWFTPPSLRHFLFPLGTRPLFRCLIIPACPNFRNFFGLVSSSRAPSRIHQAAPRALCRGS
jgi:hypothetical protein